MDWNVVIERNREALKRVLASLVAMAGIAAPTSPLVGEDGSARRGEAETLAEPGEGSLSGRPTLPRHLHRAVLRLLRPAEAAVRRLVIVAARDLVVELPPARPRKSDPKAAHAVLRSLGIAVVIPHNLPHPEVRALSLPLGEPPRAEVRGKGKFPRTPARRIALPLFDPIRTPRLLSLSKGRPRYVPAHAAPRILSFDGARPHRLPPPPAPGDPIDATRLALRLSALASALDDLPKHARRFARWRARTAAGAQSSETSTRGPNRTTARRISPLRPGRPPGQRPANSRRPAHEVHDVLGDLQHFAIKALEQPDTS